MIGGGGSDNSRIWYNTYNGGIDIGNCKVCEFEPWCQLKRQTSYHQCISIETSPGT